MVNRPWSRSCVGIACLLIAACGDDTGGGSTEGASTGASGGSSSSGAASVVGSGGTGVSSGTGGNGTGGGALSFENDIWPILTMPRNPPFSGSNDSCSGANGCHLGGAGGLSLPDSTTAYTNLIGKPSNSMLCADKIEVVASDPDQSCFVVFYEQRLRDGLMWVDKAETDIVRAWVAQGAAP